MENKFGVFTTSSHKLALVSGPHLSRIARPKTAHKRKRCASCTRADRRTCVHLPRARAQIGEHACICLVHACRSANMRASASCTRAGRRACVHVPRARMQIGEHTCTWDVKVCRTRLRPWNSGRTVLVFTCRHTLQFRRQQKTNIFGPVAFDYEEKRNAFFIYFQHISTVGNINAESSCGEPDPESGDQTRDYRFQGRPLRGRGERVLSISLFQPRRLREIEGSGIS